MEAEVSWLCSQEPTTAPSSSQINPVYTTVSFLSKILSDIILPSTSMSC
jgi:hypothetical protein